MGEVIYGAGGHGRELAFQLIQQGRPVVAYVDDFNSGRLEGGVPILSYKDARYQHPSATWHVAIGNIFIREKLLTTIRTSGLRVGGFVSPYTIIAPSAILSSSVQVFGNCVVSDSCRLADDVILNYGCCISHDAHVEMGSILCPRVTIAGNVRVGKNVWLGVGCTVSNGSPSKPLMIEDGAYVGAGACIIKDVAQDEIVYGVPGRAIGKRQQDP